MSVFGGCHKGGVMSVFGECHEYVWMVSQDVQMAGLLSGGFRQGKSDLVRLGQDRSG